MSSFRSRRRVQLDASAPTRTKQSFKAECDINNIVKHWLKTGQIAHVNNRIQPTYADVSQLPASYQDALQLVRDAEMSFQSLPADIRRRYGNDPSVFLSALSDPSEAPLLREFGILMPASEPSIPPAEQNAKRSETAKPKAKPDEGSPE